MLAASKSFDYPEQEEIFKETVKILHQALPNGITRGRRLTPIALFEAVAVGAGLAFKKNRSIQTAGIKSWLDSKELLELTTSATNDRRRVVGRIDFCKTRFGG
jgi:hypothetical protein